MGNNVAGTFLWIGGGPILLLTWYYVGRYAWRVHRREKFNREWEERLGSNGEGTVGV